MIEIREMSKHIDNELEYAEEYAKFALKYQSIDKNMADMYYKLAEDETRHYNMLHVQGVKLIKEYTEKGEKIPASMQSMYDYLHERHIEKANKVKLYMDQYNM